MPDVGDVLFLFMLVTVISYAWYMGYLRGKQDGIREVGYMLDEQWRDYERFRDLVFVELGIEVE